METITTLHRSTILSPPPDGKHYCQWAARILSLITVELMVRRHSHSDFVTYNYLYWAKHFMFFRWRGTECILERFHPIIDEETFQERIN